MSALRSAIIGLAITFGSAATVAAMAAAPAVCQETISAQVAGGLIVGELLFEEDVQITTFIATWWPGYPIVTVGMAVGWYQLSDGRTISMQCSMVQPGFPD